MNTVSKLFTTLLLAFVVQISSPSVFADLKDVRDAFNSGRLDEGKYLLLELVREKNIEALRLYAEFLIKGEYFARNVNTAVIVLDQAARLGDNISRETLVKMYRRGRFVRKSESRADYYAQLNNSESATSQEPPIIPPQKTDSLPSRPTEPSAKNTDASKVEPEPPRVRPFGDNSQPRWSSDSAPSINPKASGSGFAATSDGYIVTNEHVIDGCNQVYLIYQERLKRAKVLLEDAAADVAILKINGNTPAYIKGSEADLTLGMEVLAAGFPLQDMLGSAIKITDGIISSDSVSHGMFQHSAPTQPGNSGGPLISRTGEVVGIVTAVLNPGADYNPQNVNFAVPTRVIQERLNRVNVSWELTNNEIKFDTVLLAAGLKKAAANILCF
jgi:S1-C subfamily serine protease